MRDLPALTVERVCNDLGCISLDALERVLWKLTDKKMLTTEEARAPSLTTPPAPTSLQDSGHATAIPRPDLAHAIIANSTALQRLALEYQKKTRCTIRRRWRPPARRCPLRLTKHGAGCNKNSSKAVLGETV